MTSYQYLKLTPRDPIIARDGRPFNLGQRMNSLDWPYPSVLAGSLRTLLGKQWGKNFDEETIEVLLRLRIAGPLPARDDKLFFPAPKDLLVRDVEGKRELLVLRPAEYKAGEGTNLPDNLLPVMPTRPPEEEFKPAAVPAFWSARKMEDWLADASGEQTKPPPEKGEECSGYLDTPDKDIRVHVSIERETGAADEGMLFRTVGLAFQKGVTMSARVQGEGELSEIVGSLRTLHPFGGERRLAQWEVMSNPLAGWECPERIAQALDGATHVRMVIVTPALFEAGWKPGWLTDESSRPSEMPPMELIGACVERWKPISGWSMKKLPETGKPGAKPVRRLVPAGSVYFLKTKDGQPFTAETARKLWMQPVCDEEQDRRDGFGLAIWGVWEQPEQKGDA